MSRFAVLRRPLVCLPLGCFALGLATLAGLPRIAAGDAEHVWVYSTAMCTKAHDPSDCTTIKVPVRPHFPTAAACSAYRDHDLAEKANPRLMGSCLREVEA